jgi:WS/DGAT/MGAT family acyltransferase
MDRLNGIDPIFLYADGPKTPMEVAYVCVLDPSTSPGGYSFSKVRDSLGGRLEAIAPFHRRLARAPFGIDAPRWVHDPRVDIDNHLHRVALPAPGSGAELRDLAADVLGWPLDPSLPLWEMFVVEGLEGGRVGLVAKMHHSAIDGTSAAQVLAQLLDCGPEPRAGWEGRGPVHPAAPTEAQVLADSVRSALRLPLRCARAAVETGHLTARLARRAASLGRSPLGVPFGAPDACIPPRVGHARALGFAEIPLADVVTVKERWGVTVNDVVLALVAGALRAALADLGGVPDSPLVAVVPVSVRADQELSTLGNRLSAMFVPLASDRDDPAERLVATAAAAREAKAHERAVGYGALASSLVDAVPPLLAHPAMWAVARAGLVRRLRPANLVVSNIPGPTAPLFFAGLRMESVYPIGPILDGIGLNITVQTYVDSLHVGINTTAGAVPGPAALATHLAGALTDLLAAARPGRGSPQAGAPACGREGRPKLFSVGPPPGPDRPPGGGALRGLPSGGDERRSA